MRRCIVDGCEEPFHAKNMCKLHYQRTWRLGTPHVSRSCQHGSPENRFWRYVDKRSPSECWMWTGCLDKDGYGSLKIKRTQVRAHRFSYELHIGPVPEGLLIRHTCNTPACVNPSHLAPGDHLENMRDRADSWNYRTGETAPSAKFSDAVVEAVRLASGTIRGISKRFGMSESQVGNIRRGLQRNRASTYPQEHVDLRDIGGEPVRLPAHAVMGAEFINSKGDTA